MRYDVYIRDENGNLLNFVRNKEPGIAAMEALDGMTLHAGSTITLKPVAEDPGTRVLEPVGPRALTPV